MGPHAALRCPHRPPRDRWRRRTALSPPSTHGGPGAALSRPPPGEPLPQGACAPALTVLAVSSKTSRASSKEHVSSIHSLSRFPFFISSQNEFALRTRPRTLLARSGLRNTSDRQGLVARRASAAACSPPAGSAHPCAARGPLPRIHLPRDPTSDQAPGAPSPPARPAELHVATQALPHLSLPWGPGVATSRSPRLRLAHHPSRAQLPLRGSRGAIVSKLLPSPRTHIHTKQHFQEIVLTTTFLLDFCSISLKNPLNWSVTLK